MEYNIQTEKGMINRGNWGRIKRCMQRAKRGEKIITGF